MRINPDTKDALLFMTGLLGMVAQGVLAAFGIQPSLALIGAYLTMCGIAAGSSMLGIGRRDDANDDSERNRDVPARRKAAGSRTKRRGGNGKSDDA